MSEAGPPHYLVEAHGVEASHRNSILRGVVRGVKLVITESVWMQMSL